MAKILSGEEAIRAPWKFYFENLVYDGNQEEPLEVPDTIEDRQAKWRNGKEGN